eukprot:sb/3478034/
MFPLYCCTVGRVCVREKVRLAAREDIKNLVPICDAALNYRLEQCTCNAEVVGSSPALARYFSNFPPYLILNRSHSLISSKKCVSFIGQINCVGGELRDTATIL